LIQALEATLRKHGISSTPGEFVKLILEDIGILDEAIMATQAENRTLTYWTQRMQLSSSKVALDYLSRFL
jgi:hypothetical protein